MVRFFAIAAAVLFIGAIAGALFFRFAPIDADAWHVDPETVARPERPNHVLVRAEDGDRTAPVFAVDADTLAYEVQDMLRDVPRVELIAGSPEARHMTLLVRSALWGFPDLVTIKVIEADGGSTLAIFSRSKYGYGDMGVNAARIDDWLARLAARLPEQ